jgi:hypothetical protein
LREVDSLGTPGKRMQAYNWDSRHELWSRVCANQRLPTKTYGTQTERAGLGIGSFAIANGGRRYSGNASNWWRIGLFSDSSKVGFVEAGIEATQLHELCVGPAFHYAALIQDHH